LKRVVKKIPASVLKSVTGNSLFRSSRSNGIDGAEYSTLLMSSDDRSDLAEIDVE
jgi:hypothetical protein